MSSNQSSVTTRGRIASSKGSGSVQNGANNTAESEPKAQGDSPTPPPRVKHYSGLFENINRQLTDLRSDVNNIRGQVNSIELKVNKLVSDNTALQENVKRDVDNEVSLLVARFQCVEASIDTLKVQMNPEYDTESTLVATGIPQSPNENIVREAEKLVHDVLNEPEIPVLRAMRLPNRNNPGKPPLVKIQVDNRDNKVKILRKKGNLQGDDTYGNVFLRSSKTHVERILEMNVRKLLNEIPGGNDKYWLTSNGKLVERENGDGASGGFNATGSGFRRGGRGGGRGNRGGNRGRGGSRGGGP